MGRPRTGIGAHFEDLMHHRRTAERLLGTDHHWSMLAIGRHQMQFAATGAWMGGNVRVGLEDSLFLGKGNLARCNAEQVRNVRHIVEELGLEIASPSEVRAMLARKGAAQVSV